MSPGGCGRVRHLWSRCYYYYFWAQQKKLKTFYGVLQVFSCQTTPSSSLGKFRIKSYGARKSALEISVSAGRVVKAGECGPGGRWFNPRQRLFFRQFRIVAKCFKMAGGGSNWGGKGVCARKLMRAGVFEGDLGPPEGRRAGLGRAAGGEGRRR